MSLLSTFIKKLEQLKIISKEKLNDVKVAAVVEANKVINNTTLNLTQVKEKLDTIVDLTNDAKNKVAVEAEKISNNNLAYLMYLRIKTNTYNKATDSYIQNRKLTFEESFKNNKFDNNCWKLEQACWGRFNQKDEYIIKEQGYKIENEQLQFYINSDTGIWNGWEGTGPYYYNTASFMTKENPNNNDKGFYQKYGRFEIKFKLLETKYAWPAFWLLSNRPTNNENNLTPILPEIDIFEGISTIKGLIFTLHYGSNYNTPDKKMEATTIKNIDLSKEFWIMSIEWTDKYIKWYLNNYLVKESYFYKISTIHQPIYPCYMILNDGLYHKYIDIVKNKNINLKSMLVDWIRVYE
jgi:beta-glucanase (GH16 family)